MAAKFNIKKMLKKCKVLDKGHVELIDGMATDPMLKIVNSARVSFQKESTSLTDADTRLIKYLIEHEHFSTLRHSYFSFRVKAPLCVFRQWWKYQIGSEWVEGGETGTVKIPETNWNEACLTGETNVYTEATHSGKKKLVKYSIKKLFDYWNSDKNEKIRKLKVRCLDESRQEFATNNIVDVVDRGLQEVFEVRLASGKKIKCTKNHKVLTECGWQTMGAVLDLRIDSNNTVLYKPNVKWATNGTKLNTGRQGNFPHKIISSITADMSRAFNLDAEITRPKFESVVDVTFAGQQHCYDLEMANPNKNFVANGVVVHNSGRYVEFEPEFYIPNVIRIQSKNNKQGSHGKLEKIENIDLDPVKFFENACLRQYEDYLTLIKSGAAKEQARMLLPQNIYSECIWTCSLQTILFFLHQRLKVDAQFEIREYAAAIKELINPMFVDGIV